MVDILCQLLRLEGDGQLMTIVQLAGFPAEVFDAIVSVLFRLAFEFGLWSDGALPLLVVCEEAHQLRQCRPRRSASSRRARRSSRIAKEGRKYGVFLGLVTQRPAQIDPTLVSQCSTVFAMRMGNEADQKIVRAAVVRSGRPAARLPRLARHARGAGVRRRRAGGDAAALQGIARGAHSAERGGLGRPRRHRRQRRPRSGDGGGGALARRRHEQQAGRQSALEPTVRFHTKQ